MRSWLLKTFTRSRGAGGVPCDSVTRLMVDVQPLPPIVQCMVSADGRGVRWG